MSDERRSTLSRTTAGPRGCFTYRALLCVAIGFAAGILSGLLGVGGGVMLVPALVYLLHLSQRQAHGTSLVAILFTVVVGAWYYSAHGQVDWLIAVELAFGGVSGAIVGAKLCALCSNRRLRQIFGVFLVLIALRMFANGALFLLADGSPAAQAQVVDASSLGGAALTIGIGVLTGVLSGLLGIGGGLVMIPAMIFLLGLAQKLAQGISLAVIIPVSISGGLIHYKHGNLRADVGAWVAVGGALGSITGARWAIGMDPMVLRAIFGLLILAFGIAMVSTRGRPAGDESGFH